MQALSIIVLGAGIAGLWQALTLARRGHSVQLIETTATPFTGAASRLAGAMLAPYCEEESAEPIVRELGLEAMTLWRDTYPGVIGNGTLVVAAARDRSELVRFARMTMGHATVDAENIARLEPDLAGRFTSGLLYAEEAHMAPAEAMTFLLEQVCRAGADVRFGTPATGHEEGIVIDCRGLAARTELAKLRGVRGERILIRSGEVRLSRPVRLVHPRHPLYVVPWGGGRFMIGATVIESEDPAPMTVRSALELLGLAYTLHPAFGEAEILDLAAGLRPAFPDNLPRIVVAGRRLAVNGLFRHGFLLAPVLARIVANYLESGAAHPLIVSDT